MNCNCFETLISKVRKQHKDEKELSVDWQNRVYFFGKDVNAPTVLKIDFEYRQVKTNGKLYKNVTKKSISCILRFCPFCGIEIK